MNISIVLFSFIESYVFPIAIVKWMIILAKYGGLISLLKGYNNKVNHDGGNSTVEYKYSLELLTHSVTRQLTSSIGSQKTTQMISNLTIVTYSDNKITQLSYCGQDCVKIPPALGKMYGAKVHCLDLSYNCIETLKGLEQFTRLEELILDNNKLSDRVAFAYLPNLKTLSLNNNQITDLEGLVDKIRERFPGLTYLSLLSNKACPNQLSDLDKDESDYQRYRYFVIHKLPSLRFLDSRRISPEERSEALKRGEFARVRRPTTTTTEVTDIVTSDARPLPIDFAALGKHKGAYGKCRYKYTGKHSEGNRFIVNSDL